MTKAATPAHPWSAFADVQFQPVIAYRGIVEDPVRDMTVRHPFHTWWWVVRGRATIRNREERWIAEPGMWLLVPPDFQRHQHLAPGTALVSISFQLSWSFGQPVLSLDRPIVATAGGRLLRLALRAVRALEDDQGRGNVPVRERRLTVNGWLRFRAEFHGFMDALVEKAIERGAVITEPEIGDARLAAVLRELGQRINVRPLPYGRWREQFHISRPQLDRLARGQLGMSLQAWRNRMLAREVRRRLMPGSVSIKELAAGFGFVDSAHFHRWVVQHLGAKPSALRGTAV